MAMTALLSCEKYLWMADWFIILCYSLTHFGRNYFSGFRCFGHL